MLDKITKWFPWIRTEWKLAQDARFVFRSMSMQALTIGGIVLSVFIAVGFSRTTLLVTLGITIAMAVYGWMLQQSELTDEQDKAGEV